MKADPLKFDKTNRELNEHNSKIYTFIVMPQLGMNLQDLFAKRNAHFTKV